MFYTLFFMLGCIAGAGLFAVVRWYKTLRVKRNAVPQQLSVMPEISAEEKRWMAYHEAGHAVVAFFLPEILPIERVSIVPLPGEYGFGSVRFARDTRLNQTKTALLHEIAVSLAGRLAEEICLNIVSSSCIHDLQKANSIARIMVLSLGMGKQCRFLQLQYNNQKFECSSNILAASEQDIQEIFGESEDIARAVITSHKLQIEQLALALLEGKSLTGDELAILLSGEVYHAGKVS